MTAPPAWLTTAVGSPAFTARRAGWGFRNETWIVEPAGAQAVVLQRRLDASDPTGPGGLVTRSLVRSAGLPTPEPSRMPSGPGEVIVSLPFVEGVVAADLLGTRAGATLVGRVCGAIEASLQAVEAGAAPLPRTWASGRALRAAAGGWMAALPMPLPPGVSARLVVALDRAAQEADIAVPRLAHGDLAPVNVLLDDGRLTAVLDLDRVQLALPVYDAAWFAWVVTFHHGDVADAAWAAFGDASHGAARTVRSPAALAWLWPLLLLERLAEARDDRERAMWVERIEATEAGRND